MTKLKLSVRTGRTHAQKYPVISLALFVVFLKPEIILIFSFLSYGIGRYCFAYKSFMKLHSPRANRIQVGVGGILSQANKLRSSFVKE